MVRMKVLNMHKLNIYQILNSDGDLAPLFN